MSPAWSRGAGRLACFAYCGYPRRGRRLFAAAALFFFLAGFTAKSGAETAALDDELRCLALNVYWEARSLPAVERRAVAFVTMNRVRSPKFPDSVCEVVRQGGEALRGACQFSWWCDGKSDKPKNKKAWRLSLETAQEVIAKRVKDPTKGALYFHLASVAPAWARTMRRTATLGPHIFYR